jgi:hypothetical protein
VVKDRGGEFVDPLLGRAADPAAVAVAGRGQVGFRYPALEVVDRRDLPGISADRRGCFVDDRA